MQKLVIFFLFFYASSGVAKSFDEVSCNIYDSLVFTLETIAFNIANHKTTRVEGGGAFIPKSTHCANGKCKRINGKSNSILVYSPSHPDAKKNGYVSYPNINIDVERMHFQIIAEKIFSVASKGECHSVYNARTKTLTTVTYNNNNKIDSFIKNQNGEIIIWSSQTKDKIFSVNLLSGVSSTDT